MRNIKNIARALKRKVSEKGPSSNVPKIFYCHVPKCAGTSVTKTIRKKMFPFYRAETFGFNRRACRQSSQVFSLDEMRVREIVLSYNLSMPQNYFGSGHVYCRPNLVESHMNEWDFVTILRNPIDRWISEYVYNTYKNRGLGKNTLPLEDYLVSSIGKHTGISFIKYFSSIPSDYVGNFDEFVDEAVANLGRFSVIGTLENLEGWCESFKANYNKDISIQRSNMSPNLEAVDRILSNDSMLRKIEMLCEPDLHIYYQIVEKTKVIAR